MTTVLHLIQRVEWERLVADDPITNPSLQTEGFIHCTDDEQVLLRVANAFYRSVPGDFVVLDVTVEDLTSACIWEAPAHLTSADTDAAPAAPLAPLFPHVYGPIDRTAVTGARAVVRNSDGSFVGYADASST